MISLTCSVFFQGLIIPQYQYRSCDRVSKGLQSDTNYRYETTHTLIGSVMYGDAHNTCHDNCQSPRSPNPGRVLHIHMIILFYWTYSPGATVSELLQRRWKSRRAFHLAIVKHPQMSRPIPITMSFVRTLWPESQAVVVICRLVKFPVQCQDYFKASWVSSGLTVRNYINDARGWGWELGECNQTSLADLDMSVLSASPEIRSKQSRWRHVILVKRYQPAASTDNEAAFKCL